MNITLKSSKTNQYYIGSLNDILSEKQIQIILSRIIDWKFKETIFSNIDVDGTKLNVLATSLNNCNIQFDSIVNDGINLLHYKEGSLMTFSKGFIFVIAIEELSSLLNCTIDELVGNMSNSNILSDCDDGINLSKLNYAKEVIIKVGDKKIKLFNSKI